MKKFKFLIAIFVFLLTVCVTANASNNAKFIDVSQEDWFYDYVYTLVNSGVINGTSPETFAPKDNFSIAEAATVITRYLNLDSLAAKYSNEMKNLQIPGSDKWFCGYMQVMHETRIFDANSYGFELINGYISIPDASVVTTPIKRKDFALMIAKSFEISGELKAENAPAGIGGYGYDFIITGCYDATIYKYAELIKDYNQITEPYKDSILKMYYNGIFAGDDLGNFNPDSFLTRAEMAKVICVITNFDMRYRKEYRLLPSQCILSESDFVIDQDNSKRLSEEKAFDIISAIGSDSISYDGNYVSYTQKNITPSGYACDAYIYSGKEYKSVTMNDIGSNYSQYSAQCKVKDNKFEIVLVLRNLSKNCRIEGAVIATADNNGNLIFTNTLK